MRLLRAGSVEYFVILTLDGFAFWRVLVVHTLDILSVVLPYEGMLICSYQKRLEHFPKALIGTKFSADILNRLRNCLEMKKNYSSVLYEKLDVEEMLDTFIKDMRALHEFQKEKQDGTAFSVDRRRLG